MISDPPKTEPQTPIYRVKAGETRQFRILGTTVMGTTTHWLGRSRLCTTRTDCPGCFAGVEQRWCGYIAVADHRKQKGLLEISASGGDWWAKQLEKGGLFDVIVQVGKKSRFAALTIFGTKPANTPLPETVPPEEVWRWLMRILGMPAQRPNEEFPSWEGRIVEAAHNALQRDLGSRNRAVS